MMQFLNVSAFEFFNLKPESPQSVGSKVPCPNPVCKSYKRNTTELLSQRYNQNIKELTNRFICKECKQIFDAVAADPTRKIVVLERGETWNNLWISGWSDSTVGSCALAKKLGVDSLPARRHALKSGLKFPRTVKGRTVHIPEASKPEKSKQIYNGSDKIHWTKLVRKNPELSRSEIRRLEPALFVRLYRNNKSWLAAQSPKRSPRHKTTSRVDWEQRDQETTERIAAAFNKLCRSSPNHPRVTIKELARLSDTERYLSKHLEKLPKTQLVLEQLVESIEAFAIRRINFVLKQFKACDECPTRSHFLYKAGLGSKVKKLCKFSLRLSKHSLNFALNA